MVISNTFASMRPGKGDVCQGGDYRGFRSQDQTPQRSILKLTRVCRGKLRIRPPTLRANRQRDGCGALALKHPTQRLGIVRFRKKDAETIGLFAECALRR